MSISLERLQIFKLFMMFFEVASSAKAMNVISRNFKTPDATNASDIKCKISRLLCKVLRSPALYDSGVSTTLENGSQYELSNISRIGSRSDVATEYFKFNLDIRTRTACELFSNSGKYQPYILPTELRDAFLSKMISASCPEVSQVIKDNYTLVFGCIKEHALRNVSVNNGRNFVLAEMNSFGHISRIGEKSETLKYAMMNNDYGNYFLMNSQISFTRLHEKLKSGRELLLSDVFTPSTAVRGGSEFINDYSLRAYPNLIAELTAEDAGNLIVPLTRNPDGRYVAIFCRNHIDETTGEAQIYPDLVDRSYNVRMTFTEPGLSDMENFIKINEYYKKAIPIMLTTTGSETSLAMQAHNHTYTNRSAAQ